MRVKICGVTHPKDAEIAARLGADEIGMIISRRFHRSVSLPQAQEIIAATRSGGAIPVAVFVDESFEQILETAEALNLEKIQLHGERSRGAFSLLQDRYQVIFAVSGKPPASNMLTLLFDGKEGGSGKPFPWESFTPPNAPWILGGGLTPSNVKRGIDLLHPSGVDVSSGVETPYRLRKDRFLLEAFITAAKS